MLSATTANTTTVSSYNRSGASHSLLRSEPVERIIPSPDQPSTTPENYKDKVSLSGDGIEKSRQPGRQSSRPETIIGTGTDTSSLAAEEDVGQKDQAGNSLSAEELKAVQQLKARDLEVKAHEMAHLTAAGQYARGGPSYTYQLGPDGRRYAVGGEVPIDVSAENTPEATIQKMDLVQRAALAPAEPSAADRSIAAMASAQENQARSQLQAEKAKHSQATSPPGENARAGQLSQNPTGSAAGEQMPQLRRSSLDLIA